MLAKLLLAELGPRGTIPDHKRAPPMKTIFTVLSLALGTFITSPAGAQEVLPFPPTPSASTAGLTMSTSTYQKRVDPKRLPADAPNILIILMDDVGPGQASRMGGRSILRRSTASQRWV